MNLEMFDFSIYFPVAQIVFTGIFIVAVIVGAIGMSTLKKNKDQNENRRLAKEMEEEYRMQQSRKEDDDNLEKIMNDEYS